MNLLEKELFENIEKRNKGKNIFIGINRSMLIVSGIDTPKKCKGELEKIYLFNEQFKKWYNKNWTSILENQSSMHQALSIFGYMYERLNKIKEDSSSIREGDKFLLKNPFQNIGKNQEIFASWISLCASQKIREISLLSDGEKLRGCFSDGKNDYVFNPAKQNCTELEENSGYVKYSKNAIISEILTQRAWGRYKSGRFNETIKDCSKALVFTPTYINSLFCRGLSKKQIGMRGKKYSQIYLEGAIYDFESVVKIKPNYWKTYLEMMGIYLKLGNTEKANDCRGRVLAFGEANLKNLVFEELKKTKRISLLDKLF